MAKLLKCSWQRQAFEKYLLVFGPFLKQFLFGFGVDGLTFQMEGSQTFRSIFKVLGWMAKQVTSEQAKGCPQ